MRATTADYKAMCGFEGLDRQRLRQSPRLEEKDNDGDR